MNSLTTQYRRSQLVALPVTGGKGPVQFVYGVRVQGAVEPVSYPFAEWVVGDFNSQGEKAECENSTGGFVTEEASPYVSYGGSQNRGELSICGLTTPTNASAHSISLSAITESLR